MSEGLVIDNVKTFYGDFQALHDISLSVAPGEVLALIGANGAGKSTLLKTICGLLAPASGAIRWRGENIAGLRGSQTLKRGIALVPEGRRLFPSLSVEENLVIGGQIGRTGHWTLATIFQLFPILEEKRKVPSTALSGGQQQMVAIARGLMSNPELILLDELSLGLAPIVIKDIYAKLADITATGMSAILVEQDVSRALASASRFVCMTEGKVTLRGDPGSHSRDAITAAYFGT